MRNPRFRRLYLPLMVLLCAALALPTRDVAASPGEATPLVAFRALQAHTVGALHVHLNATTGVVDFLAGSDPAVRIAYTPSPAERGDPLAIARGFLDQNRALLRLSSVAQELQLARVEPDLQLGYAHVRMAQVYRGIPVFGKQLIVHLDPRQQIVALNGQFFPGIDLPTRPSISVAQAEDTALRDLLDQQLEPDERAGVKTRVLHDKTQLMIYVDRAGKARLTWAVTIMTESPLGQWRYFVNARRPAVVHAFDSMADAKRRITFTADNTTDIPGRQLIDEGERSRDPVAQAAQDAAGKVYDYYFNTFKRDAIDGQGGPIVSTVHFGSDPEDAENAAWIGEAQQMIYGDGGRIFKPLAYGLDVVGHELTHGITDNTAQLVYEGQSGALNESYSDVFGAMIDRDDWDIGEDVVKSPPFPTRILRSLEDPGLGGVYDPSDPLRGVGQPGSVSEYADLPLSRRSDNGGVHINSGIPSHAAFFVAQALGREKTEQIYYRTLTQYLSPESDFQDAARASVRAAQDLYGAAEATAVQQAFAKVGINVSGADTVPAQPSGNNQPQGPTTPPPPESLPAGCTDLISNGDFEAQGGWNEVTAGNSTIIDTELPHTGTRSAWLGGTDQESLQSIFQEVRIPANATNVKLNYYRLIHRETTGLLGAFSQDADFSALFANANGDVIGEIEHLTSAQGDDRWSQAQFDVSQYAGKTLRLTFSAENPRGNVSSMFVDDVMLVACTTGSGPAAPQPSSNNAVYVAGTVANADTGRGVEGAQLYFLKPGLSASDAAADDTVTRDEVLTIGVTDANGYYQTEAAVPRGQTYSVIIIAGGYRPIVADDGVEIPANATNPFQADATLRRSR